MSHSECRRQADKRVREPTGWALAMSRAWPSGAGAGGAQALTVGVGFRRGVTVGQLDAAVSSVLKPHSMADVACVATLESKADEPALIAFCERHSVPLVTFSAQDIQAAFRAHSSLRGSAVVEEHLGVEGVCEPCALLAAPGGKLLCEKRALDGVTVAVATSEQPDRTRTR